MIDEDSLQERNTAMLPHLDERQRRLFAAAEARAAGHGGIAAVARVTRIAASTIGRGLKDLEAPETLPRGRVRRPGGGRKSLAETDSRLLHDLNALVEPDARGDPMSPLRWTCKSLRRLASELNKLGHKISHTVVGELLKAQKFSLQANRKTKEGADNPDRDAQFGFINAAVETALAENQPVISVDTKKKELVGDFKNAGREWRPQGSPEEVRVHDFLIAELGRAVPYGIYDLAANTGWVNVGIDNDTAAFAVQTIRRWWQDIGCVRYPLARRLLITADGGGSNGSRVRLWKRELRRYAGELKRLYALGDGHDVNAESKRLVSAARAAIDAFQPYVIRHCIADLSASERMHFGADGAGRWEIPTTTATQDDLSLLLRMDRLLQLTQQRRGQRRNDPRFHVGWQHLSTEIDRAAERADADADHVVLWHINKAKKSLGARRAKTHPKIAAVIDAIRPLLDAGEKVLVFCHHRATASELLSALERCLRAESVSQSGPPEKVWRAAWESLLPDEDSLVTPIIVARQSGWKRGGEQESQFGGRGGEMIVAPRQ